MSIQQPNQPPPESVLEVWMKMLAGETGDPFLDEINLGTGNYNKPEYWLQVQSFRRGLYASSAMARKIMEMARHETKHAIVDAIYNGEDTDLLDGIWYPEKNGLDRDEYFDKHADSIWQNLGRNADKPATYMQAIKVHEVTGIDKNWVPPHWRMLKMRHEASQSKNARALDNVFQRVKEVTGIENSEEIEL